MSLFFVGCFWGCSNASPTPIHTTADVTLLSISCSEMDRSYSYSFWMHSGESGWLFDASCFVQQNELEVELIDCPLSEEEKSAVLSIIEESDCLESMKSTKKNQLMGGGTQDGSTYSFTLMFSDGTQLLDNKRQAELESVFYTLAEKYAPSATTEQVAVG